MAGNLTTVQHALNAGEVSPRMGARMDQNKRLAGLHKCENWRPLTVGGLSRREGTVYVATCKDVFGHPVKRCMAFRASNDAAYVLELGHLYMRIFRNGQPIMVSNAPLEIATPWNDYDLGELNGEAQSIDVKYFFHRRYPTQKLVRTGVTSFALQPVAWDSPATVEEEPTGSDLGGGQLTPGATSGTGVNFTASSGSPFLASDVGRLIVSGSGRALITSRTSGTVVVADILDSFASIAPIAANLWRLRISPQAALDIDDNRSQVGEVVTLTASAAAFRSQDVGKWIPLFGGLVKIDSVTDSTHVKATIKSQLKDITVPNPDATRNWSLEVAVWSQTAGYPSCGTFFGDRLYVFQGLTINGSKSGDFENFAKGSNDDDAIQRTISDDDIDPIVWAKGVDNLIIGTGSGAFVATGGVNGLEALTPKNVTVKPIGNRGAARVAPIRIGGLLHYIQYGNRRIRELVFDFQTNKFKSPNLFQFAEHLTESHYLTETFYAAEPDSIEYAIRSDGALLALVYQEEESVMGWSVLTTNGDFKSGCAIPRPATGKDWVWVIVKRQNGTFVEYFEPDRMNSGREWNDAETDSAVFAKPADNWTVPVPGHLLGQAVRVIGDGNLYDDQIVVNQAVDIDGTVEVKPAVTISPQVRASIFEVGLNYDSVGITLEPVIDPQSGGPFITNNYFRVGARIRRALGLEFNGQQIAYRRASQNLGAQVPLQRGKVAINTAGIDPFNRIVFKQRLPFPAEVLNIVGKMHVGDEWTVGTEAEGADPFVFIGASGSSDPTNPSVPIIFEIDFLLNSDTYDFVLYDRLVQAGWNELTPVDCTVTVGSGVYLRGSNEANPAFYTGPALPMGSTKPTFIIKPGAFVDGHGGPAGAGGTGSQPGSNGGRGGDAIVIDYDINIDNQGEIRAGGGGAGGGGGGQFP